MEGGFGSGLRAKMEAHNAVEESPRSPGEAVAMATPSPPPADAGLAELRAELEASLSRERALRESLGDQLDASAREVEFEHEIGTRLAALEQRASKLDERERALVEHERQVDERLAEFDERHAELELLRAEIDVTAVRVSEREQSVALKVHELKSADDKRAAAVDKHGSLIGCGRYGDTGGSVTQIRSMFRAGFIVEPFGVLGRTRVAQL